jgi:hypothetical protein
MDMLAYSCSLYKTDMVSHRSIKIVALCVITGVASLFVYHGLFDVKPSAFDYGVVRFYGWSWILFFSMFGGMEVAPAWSPVPAVILAVGFQNFLIYFLISKFATWLRSRPTKLQRGPDG